MLKIGLTGGIGSGKSVTAEYFEQLGACIIDADLIAHQLLSLDSPLLNEIRQLFGDSFFTTEGQLNRKALGQHVFTYANERKKLENLLHPPINEQMMMAVKQASGPYAVMVIPLLTETNAQYLVDRVLVIDTPEELQVQRIMVRNGFTRTEALLRLQAQASRAQRLAFADDIIINDGSLQKLRRQVERLHKYYLHQASQSGTLGQTI